MKIWNLQTQRHLYALAVGSAAGAVTGLVGWGVYFFYTIHVLGTHAAGGRGSPTGWGVAAAAPQWSNGPRYGRWR
jgi:hypothetical protein